MTITLKRRESWTDRTVNMPPFDWGPVSQIAVHHTAGSRPRSSDDIPRLLRAIESDHIENKGWTAGAYSFAVDPYVPGRIWEIRGLRGKSGATGGPPGAPPGQRYNDTTVSVAFFGNFENIQATNVEIDNFRRLRAWLHEQSGKYPFVVRGHRDYPGNSTACPGDNLKAVLTRLSTDWDTAPAAPVNPDRGGSDFVTVDRDELAAIRTLARSIVQRATDLLGD